MQVLSQFTKRRGLAWVILLLLSSSGAAKTLQVGPGKNYPTLRAASRSPQLQDGDMIEVDSRESYCGDVTTWKHDNLTVRGVNGGRAHVQACGASEGNKGIWVVRGANFTVENMEFSGAKVPDRNGAAIRAEGAGTLTIRNCYFHQNENGVLGGGTDSTMLIEYSIFAQNGYGDGFSHNLYISHRVRKLVFQHNYSHKARVGHNLKSRAKENYILYNRIMDEDDGNASFQIDLPQGGLAFIIGNVIQQGPQAENGSMIAYANESNHPLHPAQQLYVVNNTLVNMRTKGGTFIRLKPRRAMPTQAVIRNNIFYGPGTPWLPPTGLTVIADHNDIDPTLDFAANTPRFIAPDVFDYRLLPDAPSIDAGAAPGIAHGVDLTPRFHYMQDAHRTARPIVGPLDIGAFEFSPGSHLPSSQ
jgi:hypothetical protein